MSPEIRDSSLLDPIRVNVCAEGQDWLFADLKDRFRLAGSSSLRVIVTETPIAEADAWVFIRTGEVSMSPNLARTVVCIHDLYEHDRMYLPGGERFEVRRAGGVVLSHPAQRDILSRMGVDLSATKVLERPLGALRIFKTRSRLPEVFTIGWSGRFHWRKRPEWLVECGKRLTTLGDRFRFILLGKDLEPAADGLRAAGIDYTLCSRSEYRIDDYPLVYQAMDCLLITSSTEAGPLTLFEALASGIPVVSTPVGWAPLFASRAAWCVRLGTTPQALADQLAHVQAEREVLFSRRDQISALAESPRLDTWFSEVLALAVSVARAAPT